MDVHELLADERAVSPVIGVILMVAITVILAAVVGSFVFGIGGQVQPSSPNANFQFDYEADGSTYNVTARHSGGDTISADETVQLATPAGTENFTGDVSAGKTAMVSGVAPETTVRVIWVSANGEDSSVLAEEQTPA
ncbi:type IV pilin N-terminal domain-containing protein [Halobaculum marinum]|uniref:Type IV pilin N-terminal domain-containing protein n=1 Tax=Halobaculum marinum TaxID=3031996 RepID=A0ABD5WYC1_9EURY|nr:type IV pilin N-terminal domain-containing protein [Halobaculum sp. DT55]